MSGYDPTNVWDLTKAEIEGRQQVMWAVAALKKYTPGFEKARLRTFGASLGVRESRKIIGQYNLTEHDVLNEARFDDSIGISRNFWTAIRLLLCRLPGDISMFPTGSYSLKGWRISLSQDAALPEIRFLSAATRQMMCCTVTGQGAGVAAAVSVKDNVTCSEINILKVQKTLKRQGVRIV